MSLESLRMTGAAETAETAAATAGTALPQGAVSEEEARQFRAIMERGGTPGESAGGAPEEGAEQPRAGGRQAAEPQQRAATGGRVSKDGVQDFNAVQDRSAAAAGQPESARPAAVRHDEAERFRSALERRSELPRHDAESGTARAGRRDGSAAGAAPASIASLISLAL